MTMIDDEVARCVDAEQRERQRAASTAGVETRDRHIMRAELHADRAWSLAEGESGLDPVPSTICPVPSTIWK